MSSIVEHKSKEIDTDSSFVFKLNKFNIELKENEKKMTVFLLEELKYENNPKSSSF